MTGCTQKLNLPVGLMPALRLHPTCPYEAYVRHASIRIPSDAGQWSDAWGIACETMSSQVRGLLAAKSCHSQGNGGLGLPTGASKFACVTQLGGVSQQSVCSSFL